MNSQIAGLRVASVLSGLACLAFLARLLARLHMNPGCNGRMCCGIHHVGYFPLLVAIVVSGILSGWLWSLSSTPPKAGPTQGS